MSCHPKGGTGGIPRWPRHSALAAFFLALPLSLSRPLFPCFPGCARTHVPTFRASPRLALLPYPLSRFHIVYRPPSCTNPSSMYPCLLPGDRPSCNPISPSGRSDCTDPRMSCRFRSHGPTEPTRLFLPSILGTSLAQSEFARSIFETLSPQSKPGTLVIYEGYALRSQFPLARQYHGILSRLSCRDALSKTTRWHPLSCC